MVSCPDNWPHVHVLQTVITAATFLKDGSSLTWDSWEQLLLPHSLRVAVELLEQLLHACQTNSLT